MSDGRSAPDQGGDGPDLNELRSRLEALQGSVESLGREEPPAADSPPPAEASSPPFYASPPPQVPYDYAAQAPPAYEPPPEPDYAPYQPAPVPPEPYYHAPPAATNGGTAEEIALASVTILDAGPFADLIEVRHFEEAVARLDTVRDVRVRRFGHQRAKVEIGMVGDYAIGSELYRLGRPMQVELGPDGEIIVDFTDVPAEPAATEPEVAATPAPAEPTSATESTGEAADGTGEEEKA